MARDQETDFPIAAGLVLAGMAIPPVVVALAADPATLPVDGRGHVGAAAVVFGLTAWALIEWRELDRVNVVLASVVVPWPAVLAGVHLVLLLNPGEPIPRGFVASVFRFLVGPVADLFVYAGAFGLAGVCAVGLSAAVNRATAERSRSSK